MHSTWPRSGFTWHLRAITWHRHQLHVPPIAQRKGIVHLMANGSRIEDYFVVHHSDKSTHIAILTIVMVRAPRSTYSGAFYLCAVALLGALFLPTPVSAATFKDVPEKDPLSNAVEYLSDHGILRGYDDGTFRPSQKVTRAEAVKIIVVSLGDTTGDVSNIASRSFRDVPSAAWYAPFVEYAWKKLSIVDGPPKTNDFHGGRSVTKVEFLKMLLSAQRYDFQANGDVKLALAPDVTDPQAWYYPAMRLGITTSMIMMGSDGLLHPAKELSRGDVALLLYRLSMYKEKRRTQALLSEAESELNATNASLGKKKLTQAEQSSARALLAARGAHASMPDAPIVKAALKTSEAYRALVRAYRAGMEGKYKEAISLSKDVWNLAEQAETLSPDLGNLVANVEASATEIAKQARSQQ